MARRHTYQSSLTPTQDQLLFATVDAWVGYSENRMKRAARSSEYVHWRCFNCSCDIRVHYKNSNLRNLYCKECRPKVVRKNGVILRYMMLFKNHVRAIILNNTKIKNITIQ